MIIGARPNEGKTKMLINIANEKNEKYNVYFFNNEERKSDLYEKGLDTSISILTDEFNTLEELLEMMTIANENNRTDKPNYYIFDNIGYIIKNGNVKIVIEQLVKCHNVSLSYNII